MLRRPSNSLELTWELHPEEKCPNCKDYFSSSIFVCIHVDGVDGAREGGQVGMRGGFSGDLVLNSVVNSTLWSWSRYNAILFSLQIKHSFWETSINFFLHIIKNVDQSSWRWQHIFYSMDTFPFLFITVGCYYSCCVFEILTICRRLVACIWNK